MAKEISIAVFLVICVAWGVDCQVNCTATGPGRFTDDTTTCKNYTLCVYDSSSATYLSYNYVCPSSSLFNPDAQVCTTNYTCPNSTSSNSSVCTEDGYVANPNVTDCSSYIECVNIDGTFIETVYDCPSNTSYNPNTTLCDSTYTCSTDTTFTCSSAGRFANSSDTTCQTYYLCVLASDGTYIQYDYTCPSTSVFNPTSRVCTTSYTCA